jgi:hypothetical protein
MARVTDNNHCLQFQHVGYPPSPPQVVVTEDNQRVDIVPPQDASIQTVYSLFRLNRHFNCLLYNIN